MGNSVRHVHASQMVAKAEEFLKQKGHLVQPYRQIFILLIDLLGCIFFLWVAPGVHFTLISPEYNCSIGIALMSSQQTKTGNKWKEKCCDDVPNNSGTLNEHHGSGSLENRMHGKAWLMMLYWEVQSQDSKKREGKKCFHIHCAFNHLN